jgi:DNA-binding transcriptional MerR regulator
MGLSSLRRAIADTDSDRSPGSGLLAGALARQTGVSTDTLRHYERKGVLPAPRRLANGYRSYPPEALMRVRVIRAALALGFTLDELAPLLRARDRGRPPCVAVRELAAAKLAAAETQIAELTQLVAAMRQLLATWDGRLRAAAPGEPALLLENLVLPPRPRRSTRPVRRATRKGEP